MKKKQTRLLFLFVIFLIACAILLINISSRIYLIAGLSQVIVNFFNALNNFISGTIVPSVPSVPASSSGSPSVLTIPDYKDYENTVCVEEYYIKNSNERAVLLRCVRGELGEEDGGAAHQCSNDGDCYKYQHSTCDISIRNANGFECVPEPGIGKDRCKTNLDCEKKFTNCISRIGGKQCLNIVGIGTSECSEDSDCKNSYNACERPRFDKPPKCVVRNGNLPNECDQDSDCKNPFE